MSDLHEASGLLHRAIGKLDEAQRTDSTQVQANRNSFFSPLGLDCSTKCKNHFLSNLFRLWSMFILTVSNFSSHSFQTVQQCMIEQQTLMKDVLEDSRLVKLQREGGAILARLRKESDLKYPHCDDFR